MSILDVLQHSEAAFYSVVALVSLMVGSFLNVVIHRLPIMMERAWTHSLNEYLEEQEQTPVQSSQAHASEASMSSTDEHRQPLEPAGALQSDTDVPSRTADALAQPFNLAVPRSRCPECQQLISAWQNLPVISYLLLRGKCANCKHPISVRYPLVELLTMILSLVVAWQLGPTAQAALGIVVTWFLVALTMIDLDHKLLPDNLTLPLMWIGLLAATLPIFAGLHDAVIGAALGYLILWSVYQLFKLITGKEGMGYGDFKLLAAIGALLGWQALPIVILLSSLVGAVVGMSLIALTGRDKNIPIPFGPYLAAAGWIAMLWGEALSNWYYGLLV